MRSERSSGFPLFISAPNTVQAAGAGTQRPDSVDHSASSPTIAVTTGESHNGSVPLHLARIVPVWERGSYPSGRPLGRYANPRSVRFQELEDRGALPVATARRVLQRVEPRATGPSEFDFQFGGIRRNHVASKYAATDSSQLMPQLLRTARRKSEREANPGRNFVLQQPAASTQAKRFSRVELPHVKADLPRTGDL